MGFKSPFPAKEHKTREGRTFYSSWAFTDKEGVAPKANKEALEEYEGRYIRLHYPMDKGNAAEDHPGKLVLWESSPTYGERHFEVLSNPEGLSMPEIALIADSGSLCFGYFCRGSVVNIFTD